MLIIRKSNCINTASGIVFCVRDRPVCRLKRNGVQVEKEPKYMYSILCKWPSGVQVEKKRCVD